MPQDAAPSALRMGENILVGKARQVEPHPVRQEAEAGRGQFSRPSRASMASSRSLSACR